MTKSSGSTREGGSRDVDVLGYCPSGRLPLELVVHGPVEGEGGDDGKCEGRDDIDLAVQRLPGAATGASSVR
jgi:hypothetical protein